MGGLNNRKGAIKKLKKLAITAKTETNSFRQKLDEEFSCAILPNKVTCVTRQYGNVECDFLTPEVFSPKRIILYIHGGCFIGGSKAAYRNFCASLANECSTRLVIPEFRLAPAHAFPASLEDLQNCFRTMYTEEQISMSLDSGASGEAEPEIILAGDSSGASLLMALVYNLRDRYRKSIKHIILFSPWFDISPNAELFKVKKQSDEVLTSDCIKRSSELYTYGSNLENPFVSPFYATEETLYNLPPVYIQMGSKELLLADAVKFRDKLVNFGLKCKLDVWDDMIFMFQMAEEYLAESHLAIEKIGKMIKARKMEPEDYFADYSRQAY